MIWIIIAIIIIILIKKPGILSSINPFQTIMFSLVNKTDNSTIAAISYNLKSFQTSKTLYIEKNNLKVTFAPRSPNLWEAILTYQEIVSIRIPFTISEILERKKEIDLTNTLLFRIEIAAIPLIPVPKPSLAPPSYSKPPREPR